MSPNVEWVRSAPVGRTAVLRAHGHTIAIEAQPGKITRCFRQGKPYEQPLLEHIYQERFTGTAVDAGANFGNHTLWFAIVCGLQVEAVEPLQYQVLARNVALNELTAERVRIHRVALGAEPGWARHVAKGTLVPDPDGDVQIVTLDSLSLTNVSIIKADVEDMEPDVLRGGRETILRDRPVVFAETHSGRHDAIAEVLEPWGYRPVATLNANESLTPVVRWNP